MDPKNELSDREKQLMAFAWLCFSEKPKVRITHRSQIHPKKKKIATHQQSTQVDYKKLAGLAGMTNPASASNAWAKIQKKIAAQAGHSSDSATPEAGTPRATPGKKRGAKAVADDETPVKRAKTPAKAKKVKDEPVDEDEDAAAVAGGDSDGGVVFT